MQCLSRCLAVVALVVGALASWGAELKLPALFGDHMVLQRGQAVPVWGWGNPDDAVTVSFAGQEKKATVGADGRWEIRLDPMPASAEPRELHIQAAGEAEPLVLADVLVGEVWVCSGQSNMQMSVSGVLRAEEERVAADYPQIRLFTVPNVTAPVPLDECGGMWLTCTPDTVPGFSAVGYFFGRHVMSRLEIPVGLINTSWGGTVAEAWTSAPALREKLPEFADQIDTLAESQLAIENAKVRFLEQMEAYNQSLKTLYDLEDDPASVVPKYAAGDVDDSAWKTMKLPANWETSPDFRDVDGIVWFRKSIDVPAAWAGKDIILNLGPIDEVDVTFFNGEQVGARGNMRRRDVRFWNVPREYPVPGRLVKAGRNVIAVRAMDAMGQGGLWGGPGANMVVGLAEGDDKTTLPLAGEWRCQAELILPKRPGNPNNPNRPSVLFNAMINPLIPFAVRGAIWYQGESNASRAEQYRTLLPTMISDWRTRWDCGEFPFLIVQLANFMDRQDQPVESNWAALREAQAMTVNVLPKVGLAVIIDIGDAKNIHPRNKQDVGLRLGLAAEAIAYGRDLEYSGPIFKGMTVAEGKATLTFTHAAGLVAKDGPLTGFAVAGEDHRWVWAQARIDGDTVVVSADGVPVPVAVRYAWANNPACNLYNAAGLPAVPFRTDDW